MQKSSCDLANNVAVLIASLEQTCVLHRAEKAHIFSLTYFKNKSGFVMKTYSAIYDS
jgi:hypothetical protein